MELVGGSCEDEEVVGGLGGASLEEGCWSVVDGGGGVGGEGSAGELVEGERRRRKGEREREISHMHGHILITPLALTYQV